MSQYVLDPARRGDVLPADAQRRLLVTRTALILAEAAGITLLLGVLDARLPLLALSLIITLHAALNLVAGWRMRQGDVGSLEVAMQLAVDAASIAALVYLTGGYANPFISLLLVPLILAAVMLPAWHAWGMAAWVGALYTALMHYYQPLALQVSAAAAVDLHLAGMWLNFLLTAVLVAAFVGHLAAALRQRDVALAEAREQRMRGDQLFALGLQAASAAHDLATPMASMRLALDELHADYTGDEELARPLALLNGQFARMEVVLARLARAARAQELTPGPPLPAGEWLRRLLEHWGLMWPQVSVELRVDGAPPDVMDDPALEGVLMSLLNNAAEASPAHVGLRCAREAQAWLFEVSDRGGGLATGKLPGWGVGLELARATVTRLGGELSLLETPGGGVLARVRLPFPEPGK